MTSVRTKSGGCVARPRRAPRRRRATASTSQLVRSRRREVVAHVGVVVGEEHAAARRLRRGDAWRRAVHSRSCRPVGSQRSASSTYGAAPRAAAARRDGRTDAVGRQVRRARRDATR